MKKKRLSHFSGAALVPYIGKELARVDLSI